jgi:hypothetical protein
MGTKLRRDEKDRFQNRTIEGRSEGVQGPTFMDA